MGDQRQQAPEAPEAVNARWQVFVDPARPHKEALLLVGPGSTPQLLIVAGEPPNRADSGGLAEQLADLLNLAAQDRDAAVAAALEAVAVMWDNHGKPDHQFCRPIDQVQGLCDCPARAVNIRALPRKDAALRAHEARLLREMAEKLDEENDGPGYNCSVARATNWLRDEATRREGASHG